MRSIDVGRGYPRAAELFGDRRRVLAAAAVVVAGAVVYAVLARGAPAEIAPPAVSTSASPSAEGTFVLVHVAGAVRRPGLYELEPGARVADAISEAGGPGRKADVDALNLAQVVVDGTRIEVPRRGESAVTGEASSGDAGLVGLNSADVAALESIPGIGPVKAAAIIGHRDEIGGFTSLEQLLDVSGIGPATFESIRPYVTL